MNTPMNDGNDWLLQMADIEANCDLAVGGLAHELGMLAPPCEAPMVPRNEAFSREPESE